MNELANQELPDSVRGDPGWKAAWHVLTRSVLRDSCAWNWVDLEKREIDFEGMLVGNPWSGGERRMIAAAASMFNHDRAINLWETCSGLDTRNVRVIAEAIWLAWQ